MALISCPKCGKQISSTASVCPHCGNNLVSEQPKVTSFQPDGMAGQAAANRSRTGPIIIGAVVVVALIGLVLYFLVFKGKSGENAATPANNNAYAQSDVYVPEEPVVKNYNVTLSVDCKKNMAMNKYDVNILVDGQLLDTLKHGTSNEYSLKLSEGSHKFEFRIAGKDITGKDLYQKNDPGSYQTMTYNVNENGTVMYYIKLTTGNNIDVSLK